MKLVRILENEGRMKERTHWTSYRFTPNILADHWERPWPVRGLGTPPGNCHHTAQRIDSDQVSSFFPFFYSLRKLPEVRPELDLTCLLLLCRTPTDLGQLEQFSLYNRATFILAFISAAHFKPSRNDATGLSCRCLQRFLLNIVFTFAADADWHCILSKPKNVSERRQTLPNLLHPISIRQLSG